MAVDGAIFPSRGAAPGGNVVEDEDDADRLPLSTIFPRLGKVQSRDSPWVLSPGPKSGKKKKPLATVDGGGVTTLEGGGRNVFGTRISVSGSGGGGSPCGRRGSFVPGDIVWAKAFPYTWWPGWVTRIRGSLCSVTLFGEGKSHSLWVEEANVRDFEGNYVRLSRISGAKLANEVDCALAELSRRTALGMACTFLSEDELMIKQIARERERFEPSKMVEFVLSKAVCPRVDYGETICAVRVSAQVCAYRCHAAAVRIGEESEGFEPGEMLGAVRCLGVSAWVCDERRGGMGRVVAQLEAYRRFMYKCPDWRYTVPAGERDAGDSSTSEDSEGSHLEMPFRCLSESEEADDLEFMYKNDMEEQCEEDNEVMQPDGDFCMINRIDLSIFDTELKPFDRRMENDHSCSGENGVAFDTAETCDVLHLNEELDSWNHNLVCGLVSFESGQVSSFNRDTSERVQEDEYNVVNAVNQVPLSRGVNFDKSSVYADSNDGDNNMSEVSCRYASPLDSLFIRKFDQTFASGTSIEMQKASDFPLMDTSVSCSLESRIENSSKFSVGTTANPVCCERGGLQLLCAILYYLHCLASDPLETKSESVLPLCQIILSYRASMFKNICDFSSIMCTDASHKAQEHDVCRHHNLVSDSYDKHQDSVVSGMREHSSIEGISFHKSDDGIELQSSAECHTNGHMPHDTGDSITINTASKTAMHKNYTAGIIESNAERRLSGKIVVDKRYPAANNEVVRKVSCLTFPVNHDCEVVTKRRFGQKATPLTSTKLHASNSLGLDAEACTLPMMLENEDSNDIKALFSKQSDISNETEVFFQDVSTYDALNLKSNSNVCAAAGTSGNNSSERKTLACGAALPPNCRYEGDSCRKRRSDHPVYSYVSKRRGNCRFTSTARLYASPLVKDSSSAVRLYASPLVKDSSSATSTTQCSTISRKTGPSSSLHMKFPKGFILPSKEDLEKVFSIFGPLDHTRTRIFFYTGAGMVVFLNPVDAETAYNYVRRNKIFESDMRFWLDPHEGRRKVSSPHAFSLSREHASKLCLKSCLKNSSIHKEEDTKKKRRVRFSAHTYVRFLQQ